MVYGKVARFEDTEIVLHMSPVLRLLNRTSLVTQIVIGLVAGIALALLAPDIARDLGFLGKVFVSALKAVAPVLAVSYTHLTLPTKRIV